MTCPRCKRGKDTDGDGNCPMCAHLTDEQLEQAKFEVQSLPAGTYRKGQIIDPRKAGL